MGEYGRNALRTVLWRRLDEPWVERCTLIRGGGESAASWAIEGTVIGTSDGAPFDVRYIVSCDKEWRTAVVEIRATIGTDAREMRLEAEGGRWLIGQIDLPDVRRCLDVDLAFTPATNTLPIRRLSLEVGDSREVRAAWVKFPDLTVQPLPQRYTRLAESRYLYESLTSGFTAELAVDDLGLVLEYQDLWQRAAEASPREARGHSTG